MADILAGGQQETPTPPAPVATGTDIPGAVASGRGSWLGPTEHQNRAMACFVECVVEKLNPTLNAITEPRSGEAEYNVLLGTSMSGIIHEDIAKVLRIAERHGGRAFISRAETAEPFSKDRPLAIVWPGRRPDGPDPEHEHDRQAAQGRRKPRSGADR